VELVEQTLGGHFAARDYFLERLEKARFAVAARVETRARDQALAGNLDHLARQIDQLAAARNRCVERKPGDGTAQRLALVDRPMLDQLPCGIERRAIVEEADPQRRQRTDSIPWS